MNELEKLAKRIQAAADTEDWPEAAEACLDYLEWHFREVVQADRTAGTDHIIEALRQIDHEA